MKIFKKKIIIIWDLDGFVGVLNSTLPYNFDSTYPEIELQFVNKALSLLEKFSIKTTFAVTGFSAESGLYPYTFPELIKEIHALGHEIASHSWRHEWIPLFTEKQVDRSLQRSKSALENTLRNDATVLGFVPPHNKPSTWLSKGAFSIGDRGIYPFFKMGDLSSLFKLLKKNNYRWIRISHKPIWRRKNNKISLPQKVYKQDGILILQNHYCGFDQKIIDYIENKQQEYFVVSAHPVMLSFNDKRPESWENFENFIKHFSNRKDIQFIRPLDIISKEFNDSK
jgi:peptidoglycan/xylan/chitin deacetylase (PgdA/CDA1 family)